MNGVRPTVAAIKAAEVQAALIAQHSGQGLSAPT